MTGEHEAVAAVAAAIEESVASQYDGSRMEFFFDHESTAHVAIAAYQHVLATRSSDAVVKAVDDLLQAQQDFTTHGFVDAYTPEGSIEEQKLEAAKQSLLALIAEHARGPVDEVLVELRRQRSTQHEEQQKAQPGTTYESWVAGIVRGLDIAILALATPVAQEEIDHDER